MLDLLGLVELTADWEPVALGVGITGITGYALHRVLVATRYEQGAYTRAGEFDAERLDKLEAKVREQGAEIEGLKKDYATQRELKHNWRSFASSLMQERWTIREFSVLHDCTEIISLMDRLDALRRDNPLMDDIKSMTRGEPE